MTNPSREEQLEAIRGKCIEANPEIFKDCGCLSHKGEGLIQHRPIRLADILLAIGEAVDKKFTDGATPENFAYLSRAAENERERRWIVALKYYDLRKDDITLQPDPTIQLIFNLLS